MFVLFPDSSLVLVTSNRIRKYMRGTVKQETPWLSKVTIVTAEAIVDLSPWPRSKHSPVGSW